MGRRAWLLVLATAVLCPLCGGARCLGQNPQPLSAEKRSALDAEIAALGRQVAAVHPDADVRIADAAIFHKGLVWALKYDREFSPADVALLNKALTRGLERVELLSSGKSPWTAKKGKLALGYVSRVDGSVQPYGLIVPQNYDSARPIRLDVVLHGSTRPVGLSELRFIDRFDDGKDASRTPPEQPFIELHPLGRVENCYRWAGETDVFEAIEDVCRRFSIDRDRIVLRGMSMGASGTWHLGLKHPDRFVALGPYCGYVDTHHFSQTPLDNFVKIGPLPEHQELGLHMLDSIDYAANAGVVPAIACMGEKDVFFDAHVLMKQAMEREGLTMTNLTSPGTGHVIDPVTHAEQMRQIGELAAKGIDRQPRELKFVTWTLKYSRCHWIQILGLQRHYARAELRARREGDTIEIDEPLNISRFAIWTGTLPEATRQLKIGATTLSMPDSIPAKSPGIVVVQEGGTWKIEGQVGDVVLSGKRPGLQGPIDDAFGEPFLCVRGTGRPWNAAAGAYAEASLARFALEWHHYFRGELPLKDDMAVTDEDLQTKHLILFGDGGSNVWIARMLPQLPLKWSKDKLELAGAAYPADRHLPALIAPNPLPTAAGRYVVLNSGHTFHEAELAKLNYLLFPRWGDWAVLEVGAPSADAPLSEGVVRAGYFGEDWSSR